MAEPNATTEIQLSQPMPQTTALAPAKRQVGALRPMTIFDITKDHLDRLSLMSEMYAQSSFNNTRNPQSQGDYFLIMMKGLEIGIPPMAAVDTINIISGKPTLDAKGMLALVKSSGLLENIVIDSDKNRCIVTLKRKGNSEQIVSFTMEEARQYKTSAWVNGSKTTIPLAEKDNWQSQPEIMLKWRAITKAMREVFPDVLAGLYTPEELDTDNTIVNDDGSMIYGELPAGQAGIGEKTKEIVGKASLNEEAVNKVVKWANDRYNIGTAEEILTFIEKDDWSFSNGDGRVACERITKVWWVKGFMQPLDAWIQETGYAQHPDDALNLIGENDWNFANSNLDTAKERITAEYKRLQSRQKTGEPEATDDASDASTSDEAPAPADNSKVVEADFTPDITWASADKETLIAWLNNNFARELDDLLRLPDFDADLQVAYADAEAAINKAKLAIEKAGWNVISTAFVCNETKSGGKITFITELGGITKWSRSAVDEMLGTDYTTNLDIANLEPGKYDNQPPILVEWSDNGRGKTVENVSPYEAAVPF